MKLVATILLLSFLPACGLFGGGNSTPNQGAQTISMDDSILSFNASEGKQLFHSFPLENTQTSALAITNIVFENNLCSSFSFYSITDPDGNTLLNTSDRILITIPGVTSDNSNNKVFVNIRFNPEDCSSSNYETLLKIYYYLKSNDPKPKIRVNSIILRSEGKAPISGAVGDICEQDDKEYEFVTEFISSIPDKQEYFLKIERMRSFIYPTGSPGNATIIGTDINGLNPEDFPNPYLRVSFSGNQFTVHQISTCDEFIIPSVDGDENFRGASTQLVSTKDFSGTVTQDAQTREVHFELKGLEVRLRSEDVPASSNIENSSGVFQVAIRTDLTSRRTAFDPNLGTPFQSEDAFTAFKAANNDKTILNIVCENSESCALEGTPLRDGSMFLVGIGDFHNDNEDFVGDDIAKTFLVNEAAFLYMELEVTLTTREEIE